MILSQIITQEILTNSLKEVFELETLPTWYYNPIKNWLMLYGNEEVRNDDVNITTSRLNEVLYNYRDNLKVKYSQYQTLMNALTSPNQTTTSSVNGNNTSTNQNSSNSKDITSSNNKISQGMGGGDLTNQDGQFNYNLDVGNATNTNTSSNNASSSETINETRSVEVNDVYMKLETLKYETSNIFANLVRDLNLNLLLRVW